MDTPSPAPAMPSADVTREELHARVIDMRAWKRSDGFFEVEGRVIDRKPYDFRSPNGVKTVPAGEAVHDMSVRLVFDEQMLVHEVSAETYSAPYDHCFQAPDSLQKIKGLRIAGGWGSEVRKRLGGAQSCTHLMELLLPIATTAYQALVMVRAAKPDVLNAQGVPVKINSCWAYADNGPLVRRKWPRYYKGS